MIDTISLAINNIINILEANMAITINGKIFSGTFTPALLAEMISAIKKLPEPEIVPYDQAKTIVKEDETLLYLQREVVYIDEFNSTNKFTKIGSKNVISCFQVYIYSETDHLALHIDYTKNFGLMVRLSEFNYTNDINVMLVGGHPCAASETKLKNFITELFDASEKLKINITIKAQKLIEQNKFTKDDKFGFIYDKILEKADILSREFFKKPIDLSYFKGRKVSDLQDRSVKDSNGVQGMFAAISQAVELRIKSLQAKVELINSMLGERLTSEKKFLESVDLLFSKEGFALLNMGYENSNLYRDSQMAHFVFDIQTHKVLIISNSMGTPNETIRDVVRDDLDQEPHYHLLYNGRTGVYSIPDLSPKFKQKCLLWKPIIQKGIAEDSVIVEFTKAMGIEYHIPTINKLVKYIKSLDGKILDSKQEMVGSHTMFFKPTKSFEKFYVENDAILVSQNLEVLNELTEHKFAAKMRIYPKYTVDALLGCDTDAQAKLVKTELANKGIKAQLITFDTSFYVCVPAINVNHYAKSIPQARASLSMK